MKKILAFATVISVALVFVLMNITAFSMFIEDNGYFMPKNEIESIMIDETQISAPSISMLAATEESYIYERMGRYYTEDNKQVDLNYPAIIREGKAIKFMLSGAYLIDTNFVYAGVSGGDIIAGHTHFSMDGIAITDNTQILAQLANGLYVATTDFVVNTKLDSYTIKANSVIYFAENLINVYQYYGGGYEYMTIRGLQGATISYIEEQLAYLDFYDKLTKVSGRIDEEINRQEELEDEIIEEAENYEEEAESAKKSKPEGSTNVPTGGVDDEQVDDLNNDDNDPVDTTTDPKPYVKPIVSVGNIYEWVYAINGDISISDESGRIIGGVYFNVYDETGRLVLNRPVTSSGIMVVGSLEPDSIYTIEGYFEYYDENNSIVFEQCLDLTSVKTLPFEGNVSPIRIDYTLSEYSNSKSMGLDGLGLKNPSAYDSSLNNSLENLHLDILPYVYILTFQFEDPDGKITTTRINTNLLTELKNGELLDYITSEVLVADTNYKYTIIPGDRYGNELRFEKNFSGTYKTSKTEPKVFINASATGVGNLEMDLSFQDVSISMVDEYYNLNLYYMGDLIEVDYEIDGVSYTGSSIRIATTNNNSKVLIKNLPYAIPLSAKAVGSYNTLDGRGVQKNQILGEASFYSASVPTGTITFVNEFTDIAGTRVTVDAALSQNSSMALSQILTDINLSFKGNDKEVVYNITKEMFNSVDVEKNYDEETQSLIIQVQDRYTFLPGIKLYASKDAILEYGAWQTLLNTAIYGLDEAYSGKVELNLAQNVLESATTYEFNMEAAIVNETSSYNISSITITDSFTTLKQEPLIYYADFFISGNFIEIYDLTVTDPEEAIIGNKVIMQLWEDDVLIDSDQFDKNTLIEVERSDLLRAGHTYTLKFVAPEYNLTPYTSMAKYNFIMLEYSFKHEEGLRAGIELEGFRSSYGGIDTSGDYGYLDNNYTINKAFDKTSRSIIDREGYFVTDYLTYKGNSQYYSVFKDFVSTGNTFTVAFYDASYKYIGYWENSGFAHINALNKYTGQEQFAYSNAKYVRINGTVDKIEAAYYYQYQESDTEVLVSNLDTSNILKGKTPSKSTAIDSTSSTLSSTDYQPCTPGETLNFRSSSYGLTIYFYDDQGVYKSNYSNLNRTLVGAWVVPSGATQFRVVLYTSHIGDEDVIHEVSRIKGADNVSPEATLKWSLYDTSGDIFFVMNKEGNAKYSVVKYVNEITKTPNYDNPMDVSDYNIVLDGDGNISVEMLRKEELESLKAYRYELIIEYNGRKILLDSIEFNTNDLVYLVRESGDLEMIHFDGYGQYLVMNDIVENENDTVVSRYFGGTLDFRGYSYTMTKEKDTSKTVDAMFNTLYRGGVIKNGEIILADGIEHRHFVSTNYGDIEHMKFTIDKSIESPMDKPLIVKNETSGIIDTFLIEIDGAVMLQGTSGIGVLTTTNNGTIRNGYTYNTDPEEGIYVYGDGGVFSYISSASSVIENIYVDLDMYWNYADKPTSSTWYTGIISGHGSGRFSNMYGITTRYNFTYNSQDKTVKKGTINTVGPGLFGSGSTTSNFKDAYKDIYLSSENSSSNSSYSEDFDIALLYDIPWSENTLGEDSNFRVEESIAQGFFPILQMNEEIFYSQPYRPLPEYKEVEEPEILSVKVSKEMKTYTDVEVIFSNPSKALITNIGAKNLSTVVINQISRDDIYVVTLRLSDPLEFVDKYYITSFTYKVSGKETTVVKSTEMDVSFYYPIYEIEDFEYLEENPKENGRLMNDLDFSEFNGEWEDVRVESIYSGTLDGTSFDVSGAANGRYKLKNISVKSEVEADDSFEGDGSQDEEDSQDDTDDEIFDGRGLFFANITGGSITNLEFENVTWDNQGGEYTSLIHWSIQADIDNVFINGISMTSKLNVSPLVYSMSGTNITNTGLNDVKIRAGLGAESFGAAGMVGLAKYSNISHSYVKGLDVLYQSNSVTTSTGVGGILGTTSGEQTKIENSYAIGTIENPRYNGGIVGNGTPYIDQCYSDVRIVAVGDYNAGISASTSTTNAYLSNSLAIGSLIVMLEDHSYTHRIGVTKNWDLAYNNYAYNGQTFNGLSIGNDDANALLTYANLTTTNAYTDKVNLGDGFDYSENGEGKTPKVLDTEGVLLPYQSDNYLLDDDVSVTIEETSINSNDTYTVKVIVDHGNYIMDNITVENMRLLSEPTILNQWSHNGTTSYQLDLRKEKAQDYYRMVTILIDPNTGNEVEMITTLYFGEPLYWEVNDEYEWQDVMRLYGNDNQNILITGTVDFARISEPMIGVTVARLDGVSTDVAIIKNLTLDGTNSENEGLVKIVNTNIGDITFQDMSIDRTKDAAGVRTSFIEVSSGTANNLVFDNCDIKLGSAIGYTMGLFGQMVDAKGIEIKNCDFSSMTESYRAYYSGILTGRASGSISNISLKNSKIDVANAGYVGGVLGIIFKTGEMSNIHADNVSVASSYLTGGITGSFECLKTENITIKNSDIYDSYNLAYVAGKSGYRIGGISGRTHYNYYATDVEAYCVENVTITGSQQVGGIAGYGGAYDAQVRNVEVVGQEYAGGMIGYCESDFSNLTAVNVYVLADYKYAGGITGSVRTLSDAHVFDSEIIAGEQAGGIAGIMNNSSAKGLTYASVHDTTVTVRDTTDNDLGVTNGTYAGGIIGNVAKNNVNLQYNYAVRTDVKATSNYAGGLYGSVSNADILYSYSAGGNVSSSNGDYVGGIAGIINNTLTTAGHFYGNHSTSNVTGSDYVGGIVGKYSISNSSARLSFYDIQSYGNVAGTGSNVYGIGYFEPGLSTNYFSSLYGGVAVYDDVQVNDEYVTSTTATNEDNTTKMFVADKKDLTSYTKLTANLSAGGYGSSTVYKTMHIPNAGNLGIFDVIIMDRTSAYYQIKLQNIALPNGAYNLSVYDKKGGSKLVNLADINILNGETNYNLSAEAAVGYDDIYIEISKALSVYGGVYFEGIGSGYNYTPIYIDGVQGNYIYSDSNKSVSISVDNASAYQWYRISEGQGYDTPVQMNITGFSDSNGIEMDLAGIYYAVDESTKTRSQMFVYETNTYHQMYSDSEGNILPYQATYSITDKGVINPSNTDLIVEGRVFSMVYRESNDGTEFVSEMHLEEEGIELKDIGFEVYSSGVDSINIEFDSSIEYVNDTSGINVNIYQEDQVYEYQVTGRILSLTYDYMEDFTVELVLGDQSIAKEIKASELRSYVSVFEKSYYYRCVDGLAGSNDIYIKGEFVNVHGDKALDSIGVIYKLSTGTIDGYTKENFTLLDDTALYVSQYSGNELHTYKNFTYNASMGLTIDTIIFVKDGVVHTLSGDTKRASISMIGSHYLDDTYSAYIDDKFELVQWNSGLNLPEETNLSGIVEISDTFESTSSIVLLRYTSGAIHAYDYITGEIIELEYPTEDMSFVQYALSLISGLFDGFDSGSAYDSGDYELGQEFIVELSDVSPQELEAIAQSISGIDVDSEILDTEDVLIEDVIVTENVALDTATDVVVSNSKDEYVSVYNPQTHTYDTFAMTELVLEEDSISMEEKIQIATENGYEGTLNNMVAATKVMKVRNSQRDILMYVLLTLSVAGLLVLLVNKSKRNKMR